VKSAASELAEAALPVRRGRGLSRAGDGQLALCRIPGPVCRSVHGRGAAV